jgi:nitrite reductase/ring-hydroxylating ferredoxin subunit
VRVASLAELPEGALCDVEVDDDVILILNAEGTIHALSAWCPHMGSSLALGKVMGTTLACWAHLWRFDVRSGQPLWPPLARVAPGYNLRRYTVEVRGGEVFVIVP